MADAIQPKTQRRVGTHNGVFHADDVLACYMITRHVSKFIGAEIVRTRDQRILSSCHALVDVGGVSDGTTFRFDHHQSHFHETFSTQHQTRLSSAGLVFKQFGREIVSSILAKKQSDRMTKKRKFSSADLQLLVDETYKNFIEAIDGKDNGISQFACGSEPHSHLLKSRYKNVTDLTSRISMLNPFWNETPTSPEYIMERFEKAMWTAGRELEDCIFYLGSCWLPARHAVRLAMDSRFEIDGEGRIIVLDRYVPWADHFFEYEKELLEWENDDEEHVTTDGALSDISFIIFGDIHSKTYRIQSIPIDESNKFENRRPFPAEWRGLNGDALCEIVGMDSCVFVHANGFIGGHKERSGAIEMAKTALDSWGPRRTRMASIGSGESSSCLLSSGDDEECFEEEGGNEAEDEGERSVFLEKTRTLSENTNSTTSLSVSLSLGEIALGITVGTNRRKVVELERASNVGCEDESCVGISFLKFFGA